MKDELLGVLATHQKQLSNEFESFSSSFKSLLDDIIKEHDTSDELTGLNPKVRTDYSRSGYLLAPITFYHPQPTPDNRKINFRAFLCIGCKT
jgi:hypothetical protein